MLLVLLLFLPVIAFLKLISLLWNQNRHDSFGNFVAGMKIVTRVI